MADRGENPGSPQSEFMRLLSHQMKAPVHAVQALLQSIFDAHSQEVPASVKDALERAISRAGEAGRIVDDLLEYQSYESGRKKDHRDFDVVGLVSDLGLRFSLGAAAKEVSIDVALPENLAVFVTGVRTGVEHAIRNLIDNAVKYSPPLGRVEIAVVLDESEKRVRISVSDAGAGIPKTEIEQLFTPFFRSKSHVANTGGTGLGLALTARIVEAHNGTVQVSSEEGKGTTFTVTLPAERIERLPDRRVRRRRVVIVGGVTSGPKAASRLRRLSEDLDITIVERNEFLSYSGCQLPFFIRDSIAHDRLPSQAERPAVSSHGTRTAHFFDAMKNITVLNLTSADEIDRKSKSLRVKRRKDGSIFHVPYDVLILATGSVPVVPSVPGGAEDLVFPLHSLEDAKRITERLGRENAQDVIIVGGGLIGVSVIEALVATGARVTLVERELNILSTYFDPDFAGKIENELTRKGVKVATGTAITSVSPVEGGVVAHSPDRTFRGDFVILSSGMRPNTDLARAAGLALGETGGIQVDEELRTSDPDIFAVGDCAETRHLLTGRHEYWPLGAISMKMGHIAADVVAGKRAVYPGSLGSVLLGCVDQQFGRTGVTSASARSAGFDPVSFVLAGPERPGYAAASTDIFLKVIADRPTRRIIGVQAFGTGDVGSKVSLFATAIANGVTTEGMFVLDLGHAPEFNHPIDIVQAACMMLNNKMDGLIETISVSEFERGRGGLTAAAIVTPDLSLRYLIPGSVEITPENLRREHLPFGEQEQVMLYSRTSMEAYQAYRYLVQRGYSGVRVLEGGSLFWSE